MLLYIVSMPKDQIPDSIYDELEKHIRSLKDSGEWFVGKHEGNYWDRYGRNNIEGADAMLDALRKGDLDALMKAHIEHNKIQDGYASFENLEADDMLRSDTVASDKIADLTIKAKLNSLGQSDPAKKRTITELRNTGISEWQVIERIIGGTWGYRSE